MKPIETENVLHGLERLFWDVDTEAIDPEVHAAWIVERVLEYGDLPDVRLLIDWLGWNAFLQYVANARFLSARTWNFWKTILEKEGLSCTRTFSREAAWIS
jgi:hypothetical protein